jgi:membrane protein DedA with SNARE-associated domain
MNGLLFLIVNVLAIMIIAFIVVIVVIVVVDAIWMTRESLNNYLLNLVAAVAVVA